MKPSYCRSSINFRPARYFAMRITLLNKATKSSTLRCNVLSAVCFVFYNTYDYKDAGDRRSGGASQIIPRYDRRCWKQRGTKLTALPGGVHHFL
jgi:hypothetical protein